jgi:hypothetical protein
MTEISKNVTYAEAIKSQTATRLGLENTPNEEQLENMKKVANECFQKAREHFGVPIAVTSFFRSPEVNRAIGGSTTSEHCQGKAMDIDADVFGGVSNSDLFHFFKDNCEFNQLIWEYGNDNNPDWVHISFNEGGNKNQILKVYRQNGRSVYVPYKD